MLIYGQDEEEEEDDCGDFGEESDPFCRVNSDCRCASLALGVQQRCQRGRCVPMSNRKGQQKPKRQQRNQHQKRKSSTSLRRRRRKSIHTQNIFFFVGDDEEEDDGRSSSSSSSRRIACWRAIQILSASHDNISVLHIMYGRRGRPASPLVGISRKKMNERFIQKEKEKTKKMGIITGAPIFPLENRIPIKRMKTKTDNISRRFR